MSEIAISKIGVIGVGVMGSMLALLLAENGLEVFIHDRSTVNMDNTKSKAEEAGLSANVHICKDYDSMCAQLDTPRAFIFSLPHGKPGDSVVRTLQPYLQPGDIVVDGSNEDYRVTQKRQALLEKQGVQYVGMGVSGGFQGARHGPSLMPGGPPEALDLLLPLLGKIAAQDEQQRACVARIGTGGSGHYVKMVHNGIEHGIMSALCEAWEIMSRCLAMDGESIGAVFDAWCKDGGLKNNFLVAISGPICRTRATSRESTKSLLDEIRDAVVQDANDSEGTGVWANEEAITAHIPTPSLSAAHNLRIASADIDLREQIHPYFNVGEVEQALMSNAEREQFLEALHDAVYATVLACFVQGMALLTRADRREGWGIDFVAVVNIWRAGCIIKSDHITDLLEQHYKQDPTLHPLCDSVIPQEISRCWPSLKKVVLTALEKDAHVPCLSATLEYLKYIGSTDLPTAFMQAQLDAFGAHGYDLKVEPVRPLAKAIGRASDGNMLKTVDTQQSGFGALVMVGEINRYWLTKGVSSSENFNSSMLF